MPQTASAPIRIQLTKKPKGATILEGFPGYGLVATITTGFLLDHLKCERIGTFYFTEVPPTLAVHGCRVVDPVGVYYNKENNLIIIHSIASPVGIEWRAADLVLDIAKQVGAKKIVSVEGVGSQEEGGSRVFHYSNASSESSKFEKLGIDCLGEGIIVGVTAALIQKTDLPICALFAETHMNLPDSKAAAAVVQALDKYLGLDVDYAPLLKQAQQFETKLKALMQQAQQAKETRDKKQLSYVG